MILFAITFGGYLMSLAGLGVQRLDVILSGLGITITGSIVMLAISLRKEVQHAT